MASLKQKGDAAELAVAADLRARGYLIAIPFGEDWDFDLIVRRACGKLERVQNKHACARDGVVAVKCLSHSLTGGRVRRTKHYTAATIDWLAVWDAASRRCADIPASELGDGRSLLHLRTEPARNNQRVGIRHFDDYLSLEEVEPAGIEPATS